MSLSKKSVIQELLWPLKFVGPWTVACFHLAQVIMSHISSWKVNSWTFSALLVFLNDRNEHQQAGLVEARGSR